MIRIKASPAIDLVFHSKRRLSAAAYARGTNFSGALGLGDFTSHSKFQRIDLGALKPVSAACGWGHTVVLSQGGELVLFGRPYDFKSLFRLNHIHSAAPFLARMASQAASMFGPTGTGVFPSPQLIDTEGRKVIAADCSAGLTAYCTEDGKAFAFGFNRWGQCAQPTSVLHVYNPAVIRGLDEEHVISLACGLQHCLALTKSGHVYAWGKGQRGQLGAGQSKASIRKQSSLPSPASTASSTSSSSLLSTASVESACDESDIALRVPFPAEGKVVSIGCGLNHSAALMEGGSIIVWGKHMSTEVEKERKYAASVQADQLSPRELMIPCSSHTGAKAVSLACSNFQTVVKTASDDIWAMGLMESSRKAVPAFIKVNIPPEIRPFAHALRVRKGFNRVSVIVDASKLSAAERLTIEHHVYQVVLNDDGAYLIPLAETAEAVTIDGKAVAVGDYASGWKHEIVIA